MNVVVTAGITLLFVETEHLREVLQELKDFADWKKLGLNLGFNSGQLNVIEKDGEDNADCLSRVIQEWLKRMHNEGEYGRPTWSNLVKALKRINLTLAEEIQERHCPINGKNDISHKHTHTSRVNPRLSDPRLSDTELSEPQSSEPSIIKIEFQAQ